MHYIKSLLNLFVEYTQMCSKSSKFFYSVYETYYTHAAYEIIAKHRLSKKKQWVAGKSL